MSYYIYETWGEIQGINLNYVISWEYHPFHVKDQTTFYAENNGNNPDIQPRLLLTLTTGKIIELWQEDATKIYEKLLPFEGKVKHKLGVPQ